MNRPVSEESLADGIKFLGEQLPVIEKQLGQHRYLAGNEITLADVSLLATLDPSEISGIDLSIYPKLSAWRKELKKQAFYTKCYGDYADQFTQPAGR
jgi:glutathione S-transferase